MKTVNFNLRTLQAKQETSILLTVHFQGKRLRMSTKENVLVCNWDNKKQRIDITRDTENARIVNQRLDGLETIVVQFLDSIKKAKTPFAIEALKKHVTGFLEQRSDFDQTAYFWQLFSAFVAYKQKTTQSHQDYNNALRKHLLATEQISCIPITFEALHYQEQGFVEQMYHYLLHTATNQKGMNGLQMNTIWKQFKNLKAFLNWCFDHAYITPFSTKHMHIATEAVQHVYLTEDELQILESLTLFGEQKIVRDLFLVSCETGMRFSDVCQLGSTTRHLAQFEIYPKKTRNLSYNNRILIPYSQRVKRILTTYPTGEFPQYTYTKIHTFNKLLKEICRQAGIVAESTFHQKIQGESVRIVRKKYELVSSHTGRRTFCTLKFLAGMPSHVIMKFSGHSSEQNFLRYLRLDAEVTATTYKSFFE
jgi:integrase